MKILVTGGAGYIGSHTCVELLQAGYEIVIVDNFANSQPAVLERIKTITGRDFLFYEGDVLRDGAAGKDFSGKRDPSGDPFCRIQGCRRIGCSSH